MSLAYRLDGGVDVICNGCDTRLHTTETKPIHAQNEATIRNDWRGSSTIPGAPAGTYCPACVTRLTEVSP